MFLNCIIGCTDRNFKTLLEILSDNHDQMRLIFKDLLHLSFDEY